MATLRPVSGISNFFSQFFHLYLSEASDSMLPAIASMNDDFTEERRTEASLTLRCAEKRHSIISSKAFWHDWHA